MSSKNGTQENTKNLWCRDAYVSFIKKKLGHNPFKESRGCHIRECTHGTNCRGAHSSDEIRPLPHITKWERTDKSIYNFPEVYDEILSVISKEKFTLKDSSTFKSRLEKINEINFIELIQLWRELACHYRKIAKEIPRKKDWQSSEPPKAHSSGYVFSNDVPCFYLLEKTEDNIWAFERITRFCKIRKLFISRLNKRDANLTIWDICCGDKNCKEGVHHINEHICIDDFLNGNCECIKKDKYETEKKLLEDDILDIKSKLSENSLKNKRREQLVSVLENKQIQLENFDRKIHYTEDTEHCKGMKSFNIQYAEYLENKKKEKAMKEEEEEKKETPSWDHSLAKQEDTQIGKVIRISLKKNK